MRSRLIAIAGVLLLGGVVAAAQGSGGKVAGEQFTGTWTGTWATSGSGGGFELTLEKGSDGVVGGRVSVTGEPTYKAVLKAMSFDGNKMRATYDFPAAENAEVVLGATFEGSRATGTWAVREKGSSEDAVSGTMDVTRKSSAAPQ